MKKSLLFVLPLLAASSAFAQFSHTPATRQAVSPALRDLPQSQRPYAPPREIPEPKKFNTAPDGLRAGQPDPVRSAATVTAPTALTAASGFAGVGIPNYAVQYAPPDTNGAVGATQYVQWVNVDFAIYDKSTRTMLPGFPKAGNAIFQSLGGYCAKYNDGDPIVLWDKAAQRWILTQFAVSQGASAGYRQCVAVSKTADAGGAYNLYEFSYGTNFNDYPKVGVGTDGNYYVTYNMFKRGRTFGGGQVCAMNGAAMRAGTAATQACYNVGTSYGGLLPADIDGTGPYRATDEYVVNFGTNSLNFWKFHADFASSNFSLTGPTNLAVASFSKACSGGTCIPQSGTNNQLDSLADRLMYRFARRQNATGESYVVNHSVTSGGVAGIRWYQITTDTALGSLKVAQQGTYQPDSSYRWMGSAAQDKVGNIVIGYSKSSGSMFPDIYYTAHLVTDPAGSMPNGEATLSAPEAGSQTGTLHRWGDYSSMSVDPADDCTLWYTTEYLQASGSFNWSTWIGTIKQANCQ